MNKKQKRLWIKELHTFNKKTAEEISVMLNIDLPEVEEYLAELNGGGSMNMTDPNKATIEQSIQEETKEEPTSIVEEKEEEPIKEKKLSKKDMVKKLYLEDNKSYEEIAAEIGLTLGTVKFYVSSGGYCKEHRYKRKKKEQSGNTTDEESVQETKVEEPEPVITESIQEEIQINESSIENPIVDDEPVIQETITEESKNEEVELVQIKEEPTFKPQKKETKPLEDDYKIERIPDEDKPYIRLDDNLVIHEGQVKKIMSRKELMRELRKDLHIKK